MVETRNLSIRDGDVLLLVGTMKGAFVLRSNGARARWDMGGPYFPGQAIYALLFDQRGGRRRLWAGGASDHWGPVLHSSDDHGRTWTHPERASVKFPEGIDASVKRIWQIHAANPGEPDTLYCGVEPAALFESRDAGENWYLVHGLWDHPHRLLWQPGGGGLCLHTILPDPRNRDRITVAISTGGVYRSDDGGRTWQVRNRGVRAQFLPDKYPEFGQCVHKIVHHPSRPERLFLQNHWGLYRSEDAGDSWQDIAHGVPSDFGFAMAMHPHEPDTVFILPLESDEFRCTPEGKLRVYRTQNGGGSWSAMTRGLPQQSPLETVLRDPMDVGPRNPAGVYFGTRSGSVWGSADSGSSWNEVMSGLPAITCIKAAVVGDPTHVRTAGPRRAKQSASKARSAGASRAKPSGRGGTTPRRAKAAGARPGARRGATRRATRKVSSRSGRRVTGRKKK